MAMMIGNDGVDREQPNPGVVRALCIGIHDIGWQVGFQGAVQKQVLFLWEIDQRLSKGEHTGKRHLVSRKFKQSMHEKAGLSLMLEGWTGHKFTDEERGGHDVEQYLDRPCMLNLQMSKDGKYVNVAGVLPMMQGMEPLKRETPKDYTPEWILKKVEEGKSKPVSEGQQELGPAWTPEVETTVLPPDPLVAKRDELRARYRAIKDSGVFGAEQLKEMDGKVTEHKENIPSIEYLIKGWEEMVKAGKGALSVAEQIF